MESMEHDPYHDWAIKRHLIYEMGQLACCYFGGGGRVQSIINQVEEVMIDRINKEVEDYEHRET